MEINIPEIHDDTSTEKNESDEESNQEELSFGGTDDENDPLAQESAALVSYCTIYYPNQTNGTSMYNGNWDYLPISKRFPAGSMFCVVLQASVGFVIVNLKVDAGVEFIDGANGIPCATVCLQGPRDKLSDVLGKITFQAPDESAGVTTIEIRTSAIIPRSTPSINAAVLTNTSKLWVRTGGAPVEVDELNLSPQRRQSYAYDTKSIYVPATKPHGQQSPTKGLWVQTNLISPIDNDVNMQSMLDNCEAELYASSSPNKTMYYVLHYPSQSQASMWTGSWQPLPFIHINSPTNESYEVLLTTTEGTLLYDAPSTNSATHHGDNTQQLRLQTTNQCLNKIISNVKFIAPGAESGVAKISVTWEALPEPVSPTASRYTLYYPTQTNGAMWKGQWSELPISSPRVSATKMEMTLTVSEGSLSLNDGANKKSIAVEGSSVDIAKKLRSIVFTAPAAGSGVAVIDMDYTVVEAVVAAPVKAVSPVTSKLWVRTGGANVESVPLIGPVTVR
ncbi:hypothetical protein THRCLA_22146, partial [Thraustotheca clavata]